MGNVGHLSLWNKSAWFRETSELWTEDIDKYNPAPIGWTIPAYSNWTNIRPKYNISYNGSKKYISLTKTDDPSYTITLFQTGYYEAVSSDFKNESGLWVTYTLNANNVAYGKLNTSMSTVIDQNTADARQIRPIKE